jgi:hypothetical protein
MLKNLLGRQEGNVLLRVLLDFTYTFWTANVIIFAEIRARF